MNPTLPPEARTADDWDRLYREGLPPWETGKPADELVRVLRDHRASIPRGMVIELGCGTGADAVYLAKAGFDVTAVEFSPIAMERARARAEMEGAAVHFVLDDVFEYIETAGKFDLIHDAGFYEFARRQDLGRLLDVLWRLSTPGSFYLVLAGNADEKKGTGAFCRNGPEGASHKMHLSPFSSPDEPLDDGPPSVTQRDIHLELGRLFEMVELRPCRLASPRRADGYPGWSCLMRRPQPLSR